MLRLLAKQQAAHLLLAFHLVSDTTGAVRHWRTNILELAEPGQAILSGHGAILIRTAGGVAAVVERILFAFHLGGEGFAVPNCRSRGKAMGGRQQRDEEHRGVHHGWLWAAANTSQRLGERADVGGAVYG